MEQHSSHPEPDMHDSANSHTDTRQRLDLVALELIRLEEEWQASHDELDAALNKKQRVLLARFEKCVREYMTISHLELFSSGFDQGARTMAMILKEQKT